MRMLIMVRGTADHYINGAHLSTNTLLESPVQHDMHGSTSQTHGCYRPASSSAWLRCRIAACSVSVHTSELVKRRGHCVGTDAELLVEHRARGRGAKGVHADADAV